MSTASAVSCFLGKAAPINMSECHLWISLLKHYVTYLVTVKAQSPIFKTWRESRCLPYKQERGRCRRVLKRDLADLIISGLSQIDVMLFQLILFKDCFFIRFEMKQEVCLASGF